MAHCTTARVASHTAAVAVGLSRLSLVAVPREQLFDSRTTGGRIGSRSMAESLAPRELVDRFLDHVDRGYHDHAAIAAVLGGA